jgi:type VI secretion system ImpM family protein
MTTMTTATAALIGLYGKLPSHGDFVTRRLPRAFVQRWDDWLQSSIVTARESLADEFVAVWAEALPWRFNLPAGACIETAVAGVLLPSEDMVGRLFPLTLAAMLTVGTEPPAEAWYAALEAAGSDARDRGDTADALISTLSAAPCTGFDVTDAASPSCGWWKGDGPHWDLPGLPDASHFLAWLREAHDATTGLTGVDPPGHSAPP